MTAARSDLALKPCPDREALAKSLCKQAGGSWTALVSGQPCIANWCEVADVILPLLSGSDGGADPDMPDLRLCSFNYLAEEMRRRGATVTPAPHGGDFANG